MVPKYLLHQKITTKFTLKKVQAFFNVFTYLSDEKCCHLYSDFKMSLKHSSNDTPYRFINSKLKATDSGTPENKCHGNEVMS